MQENLSRFGSFSILILAFCWLFEASAVGPVVGEIGKAFPGASLLQLQTIITAPFFTAIIFSLITGKLLKFVSKKSIAIIGLLIYSITGIIPAFATSVNQILFLRLLTGIGVGLVLPLANAFIADCFSGSAVEKMLGYASSISNVANVAMSLIIGILMTISWKMAFYSFSLILVIFFIALFGLPKAPPKVQPLREAGDKSPTKERLTSKIYFYALLMTIIWIFFAFATLTIALLITTEKICPTWTIGICMLVPALGSSLAGVIFPSVRRALDKSFEATSLLVFASGFAMLFFAHSFGAIIIGAALIGVGQGILVPHIFNLTAEKCKNPQQKDMAFGVVTACITFGPLLSPFVQKLVIMLNPGFTSAFRFIYAFAVVSLIIGSVSAFIVKHYAASRRLTLDSGGNTAV
jgi:MFS family permease